MGWQTLNRALQQFIMSKLRKIFTISVMMMTVLSMCIVAVPQASAAASGGDLIKMNGLSSVYYLGADGKRYVFPNEQTYFSWYNDFSGVVTIPQSELESYPLGANVTVRPGTKLVKITTNPKVYAAESNGILRWVQDEVIAKALWGDNWAKRVVDVPDAFFTNYTISSTNVSSSAYPEGSLIKLSGGADVYYINEFGEAQKVADEAAFTANRFSWSNVITATAGFTLPTQGTSISSALDTIVDTSQGGGGTGIVAGTGTGLTVSLASDTPASATIPSAASNVVLGKYNFTASSDGAVTISSLIFNRSGVGATTDFINLYLYEGSERLTNGRTINSSSNDITFNALNYTVPAGTTKTLSLVGDVDYNITGNHNFAIASASKVTTTAAVSGSFPLTSNTMSISSTYVGKVTVTKGSNPSNITAGTNDVEAASFTLEADSRENISVEQVTIYHAGTVSDSEITGLVLKQGGVTIASVDAISSEGTATFVFTTPFVIDKGNSKKFYVYADVSSDARAAQTVKFYMEANSDVKAIGQTYNYPVRVAIGTTDSAGETGTGTFDGSSTGTKYTTSSIEAGDVTVATNGPTAAYVSPGADDVNLLNFSITAQSDAEIRSFQLELHSNGFAVPDLDISDTTVSSNYVTDIKIVDTGSNQTVWGSVDISSFADAGAASNNGVYKTFTDTVTLEAGVTRNFKVTCDLSTSIGTGGTLVAVIGDVADANTFTSTSVKSTATNTYLTGIVPGTYTSGNAMTFRTAALALSRSTIVPLARDVVKGTSNVEAASFTFSTAASGNDIKVTQIKLSGYVDAYSGTAGLLKDETGTVAADGGILAVKDVVSSLKIYDRASDGILTQLGTSKAFDSSGEATFTSLAWTIPKESSKTLLVMADIASGISTILDYGEDNLVRFAVDVTTASTDVTAETVDKGTTVTATGDLPNVATGTTGAQVTVRETGTITAVDGTEPTSALVVAGTSNAAFDQVRFTSSYESMKVTKLRVKLSSGTIGNLTSATLSYKNSGGITETKTQGFDGNNADFTGLDIKVVKDTYAYVDIGANVKTITDGATAGSNVSLIIDGTTSFEAIGIDNSSTKLTAISTESTTAGNAMYVVKSKPTFTTQALSGTTISSGVENVIYKFSVTADAGADVSLKKLPFQVSVSDASASMYLHSIRLRRVASGGVTESTNLYATLANVTGDGYNTSSSNGALNDAYASAGYPWGDDANSRSMIAIFDSNNSYDGTTEGDSKGEETVNAGSTKTYELIATVGGTVGSGDSISVYMPKDSDTTFHQGQIAMDWGDYDQVVMLTASGNDGDWIWSDNSSGTTHTADWAATTLSGDWFDGGIFFPQTSAVSRSN